MSCADWLFDGGGDRRAVHGSGPAGAPPADGARARDVPDNWCARGPRADEKCGLRALIHFHGGHFHVSHKSKEARTLLYRLARFYARRTSGIVAFLAASGDRK
jgi:hypothetical protein